MCQRSLCISIYSLYATSLTSSQTQYTDTRVQARLGSRWTLASVQVSRGSRALGLLWARARASFCVTRPPALGPCSCSLYYSRVASAFPTFGLIPLTRAHYWRGGDIHHTLHRSCMTPSSVNCVTVCLSRDQAEAPARWPVLRTARLGEPGGAIHSCLVAEAEPCVADCHPASSARALLEWLQKRLIRPKIDKVRRE